MKNKMVTTAIALLSVLNGMINYSRAQDVSPIQSARIEFKPVAKGPMDTMVQITCIIDISDTVDASRIHLKVGRKMGGSEVLQKDFLIGGKNNLPAGMSYKRKGNTVYLTLGDYYYDEFYYEARLENKRGKFSPVKTFRNE